MKLPTLRRYDGYEHTTPEHRAVVRELQNLLNNHGAALTEDGRFGTETERAVRQFEHANHREPDGIVDAVLWSLLLGRKVPRGNEPNRQTYPRHHPGLARQHDVAKCYRTAIVAGASTADVPPTIIAAIGSRESHWGLALKPQGPGGTGDAVPRTTRKPWRNTPLPPDGGGFGRGLMQIDYDAHEFARSGAWQDPEANIAYGCQVLRQYKALLKRKTPLRGETLLRAAVAAYNCGPGNVLTALRQGRTVDYFTAGRDYAKDVLDRAAWFRLHDWG